MAGCPGKYKNVNVAILLATHNGKDYIEEQLESINTQTYQNFVCFIHDDMSQDSTVEIIKKYCSEYPAHFVFMGSDQCGGAKKNFMFMLNSVDADYVMFSDQDDIWLPTKIEETLSEMWKLEKKQRRSIPLCIYGDVTLTDCSLNVLSENYLGVRGEKNSTVDLLKRNVVMGCTMMANRTLINEMKKVKDIDNIYMHDWWGGLICSLNGRFSYIREPLMLYRQHENNTVGVTRNADFLRMLKEMSSWTEWCNEKKEWLSRPRRMAEELIKVIPNNHPNYEFLSKLAFIGQKNKLSRIVFYIKNNMIITTSNIIFQLMFI